MHRSPGFNPPEKESTRTSTVDCAAAAGRFKEEHRRENKNRDIYIYIYTYLPFPPSKFSPSFFQRDCSPCSISVRTWLFGEERFEWILYIYIFVGIKRENLWKDDEFENEFMELKKLLEKGLLKGC